MRVQRGLRWVKQDTVRGWWRGTVRAVGQEWDSLLDRSPMSAAAGSLLLNTVVAPIVKLHFNSFSIIITICFPYRLEIGGRDWGGGRYWTFFFFAPSVFFSLFFFLKCAALAVWLPSHHDFTSTWFRPLVIFDTLSTPSCAQKPFPRFSYSSSARPLISAMPAFLW